MKTVSYSQFSLYANCPHRWKLDYLDGLRKYEQTINTCFGSAFHNTMQEYVKCLLTESVKKADQMDLHGLLKDSLFNEYRDSLAKNGNVHYSTPAELTEFYEDGIAILDYFRRQRTVFFNSKHHELIGIEKPLRVELVNNVAFIGFIDIIIKDTRDNTYTIFDIKTSTQGWNKYQKADVTKTAQLILYKEFYAKQFGVDVDSINVEYIIVRRKINEELEFVPKRIQTFSPASGKPTRNKVGKLFMGFIQEAFKEDGSYNVENTFPAYKGKSCNYCPYKENYEACPKQNRITKDD
jgi:RecB family exonuclease